MPLSGKLLTLCYKIGAFPNKIIQKVSKKMGNSAKRKWWSVTAMRNDSSLREHRIKSLYGFVSCLLVLCSTNSTMPKVFNVVLDLSRKCKFFYSVLRDARFRKIFQKSWLNLEHALKIPGKWDITLFKKSSYLYIFNAILHPFEK